MENTNQLDRDNLLNRLDRILEWIRSCDTKSSIVLAGIGIFFTIFTSDYIFKTVKNIFVNSIQNINFSNVLYLLLFAIFIGFLIYGTFCLTRVLIPSLEKDNVADEERPIDSLYFFETITKNNYIQFRDKLKDTTKDNELEDIISQIYVNARICTFKYQYSYKGIKYSFIGIAGVIVLYIIGIILMKLGGLN